MTNRRGTALLLVLAAVLVVASLATVTLQFAAVRTRLIAEARWEQEGWLVASSALAQARVSNSATLSALGESDTVTLIQGTRPDGWQIAVQARRHGIAIALVATALRRDGAGRPFAAHRAGLLLLRSGADTVRVSAQHPRS
ncbi:MAG TPA: hypothetical protein VGM77_00665 [Gemmatimonadales bacterium]|jgi:hypothetical protein